MTAPSVDASTGRLAVVADFNETLVRERTLPAWCRHRMQAGTPVERLAAAARCLPRGALSLLVDRLGGPVLAARIGFRALRGVAIAELEEWACEGLTPHPGAAAALQRLAADAGDLELLVVSRGSPEIVVRAHLGGPAAGEWLGALPIRQPISVLAPELEVVAGSLTGRVVGSLEAKAARARLLAAPDTVFVGDRRDLAWARRLGPERRRFIQVS